MKTRRQFIFVLGAAAVAAPLAALAQKSGRVWRLAYLDPGSRQSFVDSGRFAALMEGLREHAYAEGKNIFFAGHFADGNPEQLDALALTLAQEKPDLILTLGAPAAHAAKRASGSIPILLVNGGDPVLSGLSSNLAHPDRNVTGLSDGAADTAPKLFELSRTLVPRLKRLAVLTNYNTSQQAISAHPGMLRMLQVLAKAAGVQVLHVNAQTPEELEKGFATMKRDGAQAVIAFPDGFLHQQRAQIAELARKQRLPSIFAQPGYAEAGGLLSYGADPNDNYRYAGKFVDKLLKGAKPADIPFEQPTRYYFVINRKTANALGIKLTGELLLRADGVIE